MDNSNVKSLVEKSIKKCTAKQLQDEFYGTKKEFEREEKLLFGELISGNKKPVLKS